MNLGNRNAQHSFAQIPSVNIARSSFDRSSTVKDTFDFDYLVPIYADEVLPGDTFNLNLKVFARLATQKVPIMDNMYIDYFFFFVPNRLVYDKWEALNGAQENPEDTTDYILPQITAPSGTGFTVGSLYDKMGLPTGVPGLLVKNTLPLRGYNLIYNQWFRDQNLQDSVPVPKDEGPDDVADYVLQKRGKRHDYFTSALPWPQKGPAVELNLGSTAPVIGTTSPTNTGTLSSQIAATVSRTSGNWTDAAAKTLSSQTGSTDSNPRVLRVDNWNAALGLPHNHTIAALDVTGTADLTAATAVTINALREAFQLQSLFELDARGGTRYVEILKAHFGVISPDFRLQRPEFLGSGRSHINSHPVAQTAPGDSGTLANLAAFATSVQTGNNVGFTKSFVEHGYVFAIACARADITYQQGLNRMWSRSTRYDFFWPKLQELGEQEILNSEIYAQGTSEDDDVFGYQERYAEYRYKPSEIHGQFRSTYSTSLDVWHLAEEFESLPALNDVFIVQNTPIERAIAVPSEPHILLDAWIQLKTARPMMTYSVPASLGRF